MSESMYATCGTVGLVRILYNAGRGYYMVIDENDERRFVPASRLVLVRNTYERTITHDAHENARETRSAPPERRACGE
jgi:hypothetical protein